MQKTKREHVPPPHGMTLIEILVATVLVLIAFVGLYQLFQASVRYVTNAKARESALALAVERMELMRAMPYDSLGTQGGIPQGEIAQNEMLVEGGVTFNRRTLIQYVDDPADGSGLFDINHITADYKRAKVEVSWTGLAGTSTVPLVSNFIQGGIENLSGGGTLYASILDAGGEARPGITVRVVNTELVPTIDVTTYSDSDGMVIFPGAPQGENYRVYASATGYSSAQTYPVSLENPTPTPGDVTVIEGEVSSLTLQVDRLASLTVRTWSKIEPATTTDLLDSASNLASLSGTEVVGGAIVLGEEEGEYLSSGSAYSVAVSPEYLSAWTALSFSTNAPAGADVRIRLYDGDAGGYSLISDSLIPGNAAGFISGPVSLQNIPAASYPSLIIGASLSTGDSVETPQVLSWSLSYDEGPKPLPGIAVGVRGEKTIGATAEDVPIYKFDSEITTNAAGAYTYSSLEWDDYTFSVNAGEGYDIASLCPAEEPLPVLPAASSVADLYLVPHTAHSLRVVVRDVNSGSVIENATTTLTRTGFSDTQKSDACGGAFFSGLDDTVYILEAEAPGYTAVSAPVTVEGQTVTTLSL